MFVVRFNALQSPMKQRREKLEDSLRWHQLNFDADGELQWIKEHRPAATSTDYGKNLNDAQNLHAKQKVGQICPVCKFGLYCRAYCLTVAWHARLQGCIVTRGRWVQTFQKQLKGGVWTNVHFLKQSASRGALMPRWFGKKYIRARLNDDSDAEKYYDRNCREPAWPVLEVTSL